MTELKTQWKPVKNGKGEITGYIETYLTHQEKYVTIPGISRWIDGPDLNIGKAEQISN